MAQGIEGIVGPILLERRIATCVPEEIAENAIMEDPESPANRGFAVAERIPGNAESRFYVRIILLVEGMPGTRTNDTHNYVLSGLERTWILKKVREIRVLFVRYAVELISQPEAQGYIPAHFPLILPVPIILMLTKMLVVRSLSNSTF